MVRRLIPLLLLLPLASLTVAEEFDIGSWKGEIEAWQTDRETRYRSDSGWLTIVGFYWLEPGQNTVGAGEDNAVILTAGPERAGTLVYSPREEGSGEEAPFSVVFHPAPGLEATLEVEDASSPVEGPTVLIASPPGPAGEVMVDQVRFWVLDRNSGKAAIRIQDPESEILESFTGIDNFEVDAAWRLLGRYETFPEPREMIVPNMLGHIDTTEAYGRVIFPWEGEEYSLIPMQDDAADSAFFFVFADETTGEETYGAGRFLYMHLQEDGIVVMDFNKAYNPPCAFNPWTTCPLPPEGNTLPVAVRAGELKYSGEED
jgi:uncharacterized protein (DUF1684 family)